MSIDFFRIFSSIVLYSDNVCIMDVYAGDASKNISVFLSSGIIHNTRVFLIFSLEYIVFHMALMMERNTIEDTVHSMYVYITIRRGISLEKINPVVRYTKPMYTKNQSDAYNITRRISSKRGMS